MLVLDPQPDDDAIAPGARLSRDPASFSGKGPSSAQTDTISFSRQRFDSSVEMITSPVPEPAEVPLTVTRAGLGTAWLHTREFETQPSTTAPTSERQEDHARWGLNSAADRSITHAP